MGLPAVAGAIGAGIRIGAGAYEMYSRTRTRQKAKSKRRVFSAQGGATLSREYVKTGKKKVWGLKRLKDRLLATGTQYIYRWQRTSATVLGPGQHPIAWQADPAFPTFEKWPIHLMSLTTISGDLGNSLAAKGIFTHGMIGIQYNNAGGFCQWYKNTCQQFDGVTNSPTGDWQLEQCNGPRTNVMDSMYHKWTDIKLNLYGTYSVPITYKVYLLTMKEQVDPYQFNEGVNFTSNTECNHMFTDIGRSILYSTVGQNADVKWPRDVKILKKCSVTINPMDYSNQQAEIESVFESSAPHIHELRWFIRHDRYRDYKWTKGQELIKDLSYTNGGWNVNTSVSPYCDVEWGKRVFLMITATSPKVVTNVPYETMSGEMAKTQGSYDICVRNAFNVFGNA